MYAIMRARKLTHTNQLRALTRHNAWRERTPHVDRQAPPPKVIAGSFDQGAAVEARIAELGLKTRHDTVRAVELMMTASPEWWRRDDEGRPNDMGQIREFEQRALAWARETFGRENLVSAVRHLDEASPHLHVVVTPIDDTPRQRGPQTRLNAKRWLGGKRKLTELQDGFAAAMADLGLQRGERNSGRVHQPSAQYRKQMARQLEQAANETHELANEVSAQADRVVGDRQAAIRERQAAEADRRRAARERQKSEAFAAGVAAWAAGDLIDADRDDDGRKRLRFRHRQARQFWASRVKPAFHMVWGWVRRQTGAVRQRLQRERERFGEQLRAERAAERTLVGELVRELRGARQTVGVLGGGVDERLERVERKASETVRAPAREAPTWVSQAHREADDVESRRRQQRAREDATPPPPAMPRRRWPWPRDRDAQR